MVNLPIAVLLSGPRPGLADPVADRQWLEQRSAIRRLECGGPFDPRRLVRPGTDDYDTWRRQRLEYLHSALGSL